MTAGFRASSDMTLSGAGLSCRCALGRGGIVPASVKREGDGASPAGVWQMRGVYWRADRLDRPETALPVIALQPDDGWCDAPDDPRYNCPVQLPYPASAEQLWRDDHIYDIIVELDHNRAPVTPWAGSAIFFHLAREDYRATDGCVAVAKADMLRILAHCGPGSPLEIAA